MTTPRFLAEVTVVMVDDAMIMMMMMIIFRSVSLEFEVYSYRSYGGKGYGDDVIT